jgi:flagellar L-ring protein precursor FlgH
MRAFADACRSLGQRVRLAACLAPLLGLAGCLSALAPARVAVEPTEPALPAPMVASAVPTGGIFQPAMYRPLFEDHRARLVGDVLTVTIVEKVSATQSSKSTVDKAGSLEGSITALPGISTNSFGRASAAGSSNNTFEGKGATENTNDFSGSVTVVVTEVLANGLLRVAGEKQIGVNSNVDVLRFSGLVDPRAIQPGNTVASTTIANVRVEHRGRGAAAQANSVGWLSRFFLSVMPI